MQPLKDASHLYEVERRVRHLVRPGFHITELRIAPDQSVPWHYHSEIQDAFYVLEGCLAIYLLNPKEQLRLGRGDIYAVAPRRPHLVTNGGQHSATFLVLQGVGDYDYIPFT